MDDINLENRGENRVRVEFRAGVVDIASLFPTAAAPA